MEGAGVEILCQFTINPLSRSKVGLDINNIAFELSSILNSTLLTKHYYQ